MPEPVTFSRMRPADWFEIERQPSQARVLGAEPDDINWDTAEVLASQPAAWAARRGERLVALLGIGEHYVGKHGVAWAVLGRDLGTAHLAVTRKARDVIWNSGLNRIELIARAADTSFFLQRDRADMRWALDAKRITPECKWAMLLGMTPAHLMHGYGPDCEAHMLFEWFGGQTRG
ncbi:hypothetical protein [Novosphingobium sp. BL-52-GroH]|uniref:hypothetical protein n=1 Tax=Novosphingobium sp. BL-52-GroH TaxID=3349877 RepID=UPI003851735E